MKTSNLLSQMWNKYGCLRHDISGTEQTSRFPTHRREHCQYKKNDVDRSQWHMPLTEV